MLPGNFAVHGENISLEYGEEAVLEQEFHPESYIFGKEPVKLSFTDTKVTKSGGEEKGTDAVLEVLPVRGTVLSYRVEPDMRAPWISIWTEPTTRSCGSRRSD